MKKLKKLGAMLLVLVMALSMTVTAFADGDGNGDGSGNDTTVDTTTNGSITVTNATIGESYYAYKLFGVTYGDSYIENGETVIPTTYVANEAQVKALRAAEGNVFDFAELSDGTYQVTVKDGVTEKKVIDFIKGYSSVLSGSVVSCNFPGRVVAASKINVGEEETTFTWENMPAGYYFVTSSLGSVVTIDTSNPDAEISDKNSNNPDWNNEPDGPDPDEPVKDVQNVVDGKGSGKSIDGEKVKVGDTLDYVISYFNASGASLDDVVINDTPPEGTKFAVDTVGEYITGIGFYTNGYEAEEDGKTIEVSFSDITSSNDGWSVEKTTKVKDSDGNVTETEIKTLTWQAEDIEVDNETNQITWNVKNMPDHVGVKVDFQVVVTEDALKIENHTVVNDADVIVKIGDNTYNLKTNQVENPVGDKDDPVKDVLNQSGKSIDGVKVEVDQILTYKITYKNTGENKLDSVVITDAPPTGTVYVADSARGERDSVIDGVTVDENGKNVYEGVTITVNADGTITWTFENVEIKETVTVYFDVQVTQAALSIIDKTIVNDADVRINNEYDLKTNVVTNPVDEEPDDPNPGKVIINSDGSESTVSTGAFGDTVTFDIGINAVNKVKNDANEIVQVEKYYIYDKLDPGFTLDQNSMFITINGNRYEVEEDTDQSQKNAEGVTTYTIEDNKGTLFVCHPYKISGDDKEYTLIAADINWADVEKDDEGNRTGKITALYPDCKIHLTYDATINENAVIAGDGNENNVYYDYYIAGDTHEPDPENPKYPSGSDLNHGSEEKTTTTYTYALGIQKYSKETGAPLAGAEFTAVDAGGNVIYAVKVNDGEYNYTSDAEAQDRTSSFVSNAEGQIVIKGVNIGTYTFTEAKAPDGYNLLKEPVSVKAQIDSSTTEYSKTEWTVERSFEAITKGEWDNYTGDIYEISGDKENGYSFTFVEKDQKPTTWQDDWESEAVYYKLVGTSSSGETMKTGSTTIKFPINVAILEVENSSGAELPSTGGIGTSIFYILGAILVIGAGILLVVRRRMNEDK